MPDHETKSSVTEQLGALMARPVSQADLDRASLHVIDWIACALVGRTTGTGAILAADLGDRFLGSGSSLTGAESEIIAFSLGSLGSLLEMDDLHRGALLHPGPVVIPAALAASGTISGPRFLSAIIRGYEAMIRIGVAVGPSHYAFYHNTSTCGGFGAAVAAGDAAGLDPHQIVDALGLAGSIAGGLWQCRNEPVASKPFHVGDAARRGVAAARLSGRGLTAPRFILEGPQGLFAAQAPAGNPLDVLIGRDLPWKIHETSFKPWPACRHAHPVIDATLEISKVLGPVAVDTIKSVTVETYADSVLFCDRAAPMTEFQAKFSLQHAIAVCLLRGQPALADFTMERVGSEDLAALRKKVSISASDQFTAAYPAHFGARVKLVLANDRAFEAMVADAWGDPENPMDEAAILSKARLLMSAAGLADKPQDRILDCCLDLARASSPEQLRQVFETSLPNAKSSTDKQVSP